MRKLLVFLLLLILAGSTWAQGITLPSTSIAVTDNALSTRVNPAWLGARSGVEAFFLVPYDSTGDEDFGLAVKLGPLGFTGDWVTNDQQQFNRYEIGLGLPFSRFFHFGVSKSWYRAVDWEGSWNLGLGFRPLPFISAGAVAYDLNRPLREGVELYPTYGAGLAVRPFGYRLTLSGDLLFTKSTTHDYGDELDPLLRLEAVPIDGLRLTGEYRTDSQIFAAGLSLAIDNVTLGNYRRMNENGDHLASVGYLHLTSDRFRNFFSPPDHQIVEMTLEGEIRETEAPFSFFRPMSGMTLRQLRRQIQEYADDPKVDGLLINFNNPDIGWAQMQQVRRSLEDFKATGKKLMAWSESYSQRDYYLASLCDEIYLLPVGMVDLHGLLAELSYWKGTMDKLGIGAQVARVGDYKTAGNSFLYYDTPEAEAEMINWLLDGLYDQLVSEIAAGRNWEPDTVKALIDRGPYFAQWAVDDGLVDSLVHHDVLKERLEDQDYIMTSDEAYWRTGYYQEEWPDMRIPKVAVIYAEGAIVSGESSQELFGGALMGAETIAGAIRKAREDGSVDAIIMRVDSPGGSGIASEIIYREVVRTTTGKNRKPFIVSMGNVAASGGYYIAMGADTVIAEPGTITGSIGVIALKPNLDGLYDKIGYNTHIFKRGEHADAFTLSRPFDEEELALLQDGIEEFYDDFITRVAQERDLTKEAVDDVARGRVWTGQQAQERQLVDLMGGMDLAFEIVRGQLGVESGAALDLKVMPEQKGFFDTALGDLVRLKQRPLPKDIRQALEPLYLALQVYGSEPLMLMPYKLEVK
ncbi:MAG: signal peptide peptidase SppA [Candidatus Zixiibacteriota bacterium]|nr:MAG: signal peptide peptidase SppA [candidate division Zixibacteria bacterium]